MFALRDKALSRLCLINSFVVQEDLVLFGLRGCSPINEFDTELRSERQLELTTLDYVHPRCTLGVWNRGAATVFATSGSTVPVGKEIMEGAARGGEGVNQLLCSLLAFEKGRHPRSKPEKQHDAFLQAVPCAFQRTSDDAAYDLSDPVGVGLVGDNLHCAFAQSSAATAYASNGCQVVIGHARRPDRPDSKDAGPWPRFRDLAYGGGQSRFVYILLEGRDAQAAVTEPDGAIPARLRFGSSGDLVKTLQGRLKNLGFLPDKPDGAFGERTLLAVIAFQRSAGFAPDGIVGLNTADALGLNDWPRL
jgi:endonuclease G